MNGAAKPSLLRRLPGLALHLGLAAACLVYVLWDLDLRRVLDALAAFQTGPLLLSLALGVILFLVQGLRFRAIAGTRLTLTQSIIACTFGIGLNNILPARLGELGKALYLRRHAALPIRESLGYIFWERFADLNMILLLAWAASLSSRLKFVWLSLALLVAGLWCTVALILFVPRSRSLVLRLLPFPSLRKVFEDILTHFVQVSTVGFLFRLTCYSALVWASFLGVFHFNAAVAAGLNVGLRPILVVFVVSSFGIALPSTPGGLGVFEAAIVFSFAMFGVDRESALAVAVLNRLTKNVPAIITALVFLARERLGLSDLRQAIASLRSGNDFDQAP